MFAGVRPCAGRRIGRIGWTVNRPAVDEAVPEEERPAGVAEQLPRFLGDGRSPAS